MPLPTFLGQQVGFNYLAAYEGVDLALRFNQKYRYLCSEDERKSW